MLTVDTQDETRSIKLSSKTLVHISSGLYRSTANALKELISNSFDADATQVRIDTNYPEFDVLSCSDNGDGIKRHDFERIMENIGNSLKRVGESSEPKLTRSGRPIIGRLGIGLLAIAQLCYKFTVESHHAESQTAFLAELNLDPGRINKIAEDTSTSESEVVFEIGFYKCENIVFDIEKSGVLIITDDLNDTYTRRYKEDVKREAFRPVPLDFSQFLKEVTNPKHKTIRSLGSYWQVFWELSIACPVRYVEDGPFSEAVIQSAMDYDSRDDTSSKASLSAAEIIHNLREQLVSYDFDVVVDGVSLRKPVQIASSPKKDARLTPIKYEKKVRGKTLSFEGYIYTQHGAIYPSELRGVLVRLRNIAVGTYDANFLDLATVQGFRFDWMSGEVYVSQGLEDALNIDRYSFNEVNPHYLALQNEIHNASEAAIRESRKVAEATRLNNKKIENQKPDDSKYLTAISKVMNIEYKIERTEEGATDQSPVKIDTATKEISVNRTYPGWPKNDAHRQIVEYVLIAVKLAIRASKDDQEVDKIALAILQEIL